MTSPAKVAISNFAGSIALEICKTYGLKDTKTNSRPWYNKGSEKTKEQWYMGSASTRIVR